MFLLVILLGLYGCVVFMLSFICRFDELGVGWCGVNCLGLRGVFIYCAGGEG